MDRKEMIDKGKIWQIYAAGNTDDILFEGSKAQCNSFLKTNYGKEDLKQGKVRLAKLIFES